MSLDVHRKGAVKRVLTTRAARCVCWVVVVALIGTLFFGLIAATSTGVSPAYANPSDLQSVQAQLKKAKAALAKQQAALDKLAAKENQAETQLAVTQNRIASVQAQIQTANKSLSQLADRLEVRLRDIYMNRQSDALTFVDALLNGNGSLDQVIDELSLLARVANSDNKLVTDVKSNVKDLQSLKAELASKKKQEQVNNAKFNQAVSDSMKAIESSKDSYNKLRAQVAALQKEEAARQQAIAAANATSTTKASQSGGKSTTTTKSQTGTTKKGTPTTKGGTPTTKGGTPTTKTTPTTSPKPKDPPIVGGEFVFPVAGPNSFVDSFGAPRSGGRTHKGCDIMTARNTPLVACVTGSILRTSPTNSGLGGITVWIKGKNGNTYYYAHLSSIKSGITPGVHVAAGQTVGYAGNTGNAAGGPVHLHFEIHPGGGAAIDPYPTLIKYR